MNFSTFLREDENNLDDISQGKVKVSFYPGRFQPFHMGHLELVKKLSYDYPHYKVLIGIIKGEKSSLDKNINPLPFDYQRDLIFKSLDGMAGKSVLIFSEPLSSGYLPSIIKTLREYDFEIKTLLSGPDRKKEYETQLNDLSKKFHSIRIDLVTINNRVDNISSSKVRETIKNNNLEGFKKLVSKEIWGEFNKLREYIK